MVVKRCTKPCKWMDVLSRGAKVYKQCNVCGIRDIEGSSQEFFTAADKGWLEGGPLPKRGT